MSSQAGDGLPPWVARYRKVIAYAQVARFGMQGMVMRSATPRPGDAALAVIGLIWLIRSYNKVQDDQ